MKRSKPSVVRDVQSKLKSTGLTMSDYLRMLVLKDLNKLTIEIPNNLTYNDTYKRTGERIRGGYGGCKSWESDRG